MISQCPTDHLETPSVLSSENVRYHPAAYGLQQPIVYWSESYGTQGYEAGDHDGIRDGSSSGVVLGFTRYYQSLADYLASGKRDPRVAEVNRDIFGRPI